MRTQRAAGHNAFESLFRRTLQFTNGIDAGGMSALPPAPHVPFMFHGVEVRMDVMARELAWRDLVSSEILRVIRSDAEVILELGSGWSANLFNLWLRGAPRKALYLGAELAEGGRQAARALAATQPKMKYGAHAFDWSFPDFSFVPVQARHLTVYSCYSLEQIPQLGVETIRKLLQRTSAAESVFGAFIEPVGWQFPENATDAALVERTRRYAHEKNYNLNLREVVETLAAEKRIEVLGIGVDLFGYDHNPATVIHWRRI